MLISFTLANDTIGGAVNGGKKDITRMWKEWVVRGRWSREDTYTIYYNDETIYTGSYDGAIEKMHTIKPYAKVKKTDIAIIEAVQKKLGSKLSEKEKMLVVTAYRLK